jgi:hypothetical protein
MPICKMFQMNSEDFEDTYFVLRANIIFFKVNPKFGQERSAWDRYRPVGNSSQITEIHRNYLNDFGYQTCRRTNESISTFYFRVINLVERTLKTNVTYREGQE